MANFSVPTYQGITDAGDSISSMITRAADMKRDQRNRDDDIKMRLLIGATTEDISLYVPELQDQLKTATNNEDRLSMITQAGQLANQRKSQHESLDSSVRTIGLMREAGDDISQNVGIQQNQLVQSGLPPQVIAQLQTSLGNSVTEGGAKFNVVDKELKRREAEKLEGRSYEERIYQNHVADSERRQLAAEARGDASQRAGELRRDAIHDENRYDELRMSLGLPEGTHRSIIDAANASSLIDKTEMSNQELAANSSALKWLDQFNTGKKGKREGGLDDIVKIAGDAVVLFGNNGSSLVPVPVKVEDGWFSTTWRIEGKHWAHAQFDLSNLEDEAFEQDGSGNTVRDGTTGERIEKDKDAARLFRKYEEAAASGSNRWLTKAVQPMGEEDQRNAEETFVDYSNASLQGPLQSRRGGRGSLEPSLVPINEVNPPAPPARHIAGSERPRGSGNAKGTFTVTGAAKAGSRNIQRAIETVVPSQSNSRASVGANAEFAERFGGEGAKAGKFISSGVDKLDKRLDSELADVATAFVMDARFTGKESAKALEDSFEKFALVHAKIGSSLRQALDEFDTSMARGLRGSPESRKKRWSRILRNGYHGTIGDTASYPSATQQRPSEKSAETIREFIESLRDKYKAMTPEQKKKFKADSEKYGKISRGRSR